MLTIETQLKRVKEWESEVDSNRARLNYASGALEEAKHVLAELKQDEPVSLTLLEKTEAVG